MHRLFDLYGIFDPDVTRPFATLIYAFGPAVLPEPLNCLQTMFVNGIVANDVFVRAASIADGWKLIPLDDLHMPLELDKP